MFRRQQIRIEVDTTEPMLTRVLDATGAPIRNLRAVSLNVDPGGAEFRVQLDAVVAVQGEATVELLITSPNGDHYVVDDTEAFWKVVDAGKTHGWKEVFRAVSDCLY